MAQRAYGSEITILGGGGCHGLYRMNADIGIRRRAARFGRVMSTLVGAGLKPAPTRVRAAGR